MSILQEGGTSISRNSSGNFAASASTASLSSRLMSLSRRLLIVIVLCFFLVASFAFFPALPNPKDKPPSIERWAAPPAYSPRFAATQRVYNISLVADLDLKARLELSSNKYIWESYLKRGTLTRAENGTYSVIFTKPFPLRSLYNEGGRGMELSDLVVWKDRLWTCDDRSGIVYEIDNESVIPTYVLTEGNGRTSKGFKCEWMTVRDEELWVGSLGKEWTTTKGVYINDNLSWVKVISPSGHITHTNWSSVYNYVRDLAGCSPPGYLLHEAVEWHPLQRRWYFLPRKASKEQYDEVRDEERGTNFWISLNEAYTDPKLMTVGPRDKRRGFSSFAFVPGREHEVVALKSLEEDGVTQTQIMVFDLEGRFLLEPTTVGNRKFEGVEFW